MFAPVNCRDLKRPNGTSGRLARRSTSNEGRQEKHVCRADRGDERVAEAGATRLDERVHEGAERGADQRRPEPVRPSPNLRVARLGHVAGGDHGRRPGEQDDDREHEPPRAAVDERSAEERPDRGRDPGPAGPSPDRLTAVVAVEARLDDRQAPRDHQRAGDTLKHPCCDEQPRARRRGAQEGGHREADRTEHEHASPPVPVAERAAEDDERTEGDQVAVHDPLEAAEREPEVTSDRGQGEAHDARLEKGRPRPEDDCGERPTTARRGVAQRRVG